MGGTEEELIKHIRLQNKDIIRCLVIIQSDAKTYKSMFNNCEGMLFIDATSAIIKTYFFRLQCIQARWKMLYPDP